jgi:hypothetical protein
MKISVMTRCRVEAEHLDLEKSLVSSRAPLSTTSTI